MMIQTSVVWHPQWKLWPTKGGCDTKDIQAWLGHSDITTMLNVYSHVLNSDMDKLGQVMERMVF